MRKLLFLLTWLVLMSGSALAQTGPLTVTDNTVTCYNCRKIVFGSITVSGTTATVAGGGGSGTVTSVAQSFTGGLISVAGSPVTTSGTLALTVAGTSGGIPYFSSGSTWASSAALAANALVIGGGAGVAPSTTTTAAGILTFLATPSSANFLSAITNETGTGLVMGNDTPTIITPSFTTGFTIGGVAATGTILRGNGTNFVASTFTMAAPGTTGNVLTSDGTNWTSAAPAGGSPGGSDTQLQRNNAGAFGGISGATSNGTNVTFGSGNLLATSPAFTTNQTTTNDAIGTTSTDGIVLQNTTAAAAGAQQYSPRLRLTGQGWKTNATAASQAVDWAIENQPVQGAANPTANLIFKTQVNAGGYTDRYTFASASNTVTFSVGDVALNANAASSFNIGAGGTNPAVSTNGNNVGIKSTGHWGWGSSTTGTANGDTGLTRLAAAVVRVSNMSTGAGSFCVGCTSTVGSIGTSGVGVLAIANGTAPTSSPADEFQLYSADSAAGAANAFIRNEAGEINRISGLGAINTSAFAVTSNTTLANITGLTRPVEAGRTYAFRAVMQTTAAATGGVKFAVSGTATATSISYEGILSGGAALIAQTRATALDTTVCASTTTTAGTCTIEGVIVVNAAGTLTMQFAQNSSDGGASTVLINQYMQLIPIS